MLYSVNCEECGAGGVALFACGTCMRRICCECTTCAGLCVCCMSTGSYQTDACVKCGDGRGPLYTCTICHSGVCNGCALAATVFARPTTVLCKECQMNISTGTVVGCGRCGKAMTDMEMQTYCEVCAAPLCFTCLPASFECGVVKCMSCCPAPIRLYNDGRTQTTLDGKLVSMVDLVLQQRNLGTGEDDGCVKYRYLRNRVLLGEGGQGVVYKCTTLDNEEVVSKEMTFTEEERPIYMAHLYQAQKMQKLSHRHLIKYLDVFGSENPLRISVIMPYYSEGDLNKFIERQTKPIVEQKLCSIILQIATALEHLHSLKPPLAHCDIKPANILLLNREEQVLLMDLDLCRSCDTQQPVNTKVLSKQKGNSPTYEYRAPEMTFSFGSTRSDIFSLGVVSFVLAALPESPLLLNPMGVMAVLNDADWTRESLGRAVREAIYRHSSSYSRELVELIIQMLEHKPMQRPTATEVIRRLTIIMEKNLLLKC